MWANIYNLVRDDLKLNYWEIHPRNCQFLCMIPRRRKLMLAYNKWLF